MKNNFYNNIVGLYYDGCCVDISIQTWEKWMEGAVKANKKEIERLIKRFYPEMSEEFGFQFHNPYTCYRTKTRLVYVHSAIEYFFSFEKD